MMSARPEVVYVLPNKLGGVFSYVHQLLAHRRPDAFAYAAVRTQNARDRDHNIFEPLPADRDVRFEYSLPPENVHAVLRRLALTIPCGPGVIVANDWIELALTSIHDTGRAVFAINHGDMDFYYNLAVRHQETIDAFVTYTEQMARRLRTLLPDREPATAAAGLNNIRGLPSSLVIAAADTVKLPRRRSPMSPRSPIVGI
jgi:hypothetical protein